MIGKPTVFTNVQRGNDQNEGLKVNGTEVLHTHWKVDRWARVERILGARVSFHSKISSKEQFGICKMIDSIEFIDDSRNANMHEHLKVS